MEGAIFRHVGRTLILVRKLLGRVRQAECARRAGITRAQLSRYETEVAEPSLESLGKVLGALGVGPGEFFIVLAAVDLLEGGEESLESIRRRVLKRQQTVLDEFLAGVARLREGGSVRGGIVEAEVHGEPEPSPLEVLADQTTRDETGVGASE